MVPSGTFRRRGGILLLGLGLTAWFVAASPRYWKSDEAGFPVEALSAAPKDPPPELWWLEIDDSAQGVTKRIFRGSEEKSRIVTRPGLAPSVRVEETWHGEALVDRIDYDALGRMIAETAFSDDRSARILWVEDYVYSDGLLSLVTRRTDDGATLGTIGYRYDPRGRLLSIELSGYYGSDEIGSLEGPRLPLGQWSETSSGTMRIERFDGSGNVSSVIVFKNGETVLSSSFSYEKGALVSEIDRSPKDGRTTRSDFGTDGRVSAKKVLDGQKLLESHRYVWDGAGNLLSETRLFPEPETKIDRSWDPKGNLIKEEHSENGNLVLVITWEPGDVRIEETWAGGQAVVRTRYVAGIKVREDFLSNGAVVRTKEYQ